MGILAIAAYAKGPGLGNLIFAALSRVGTPTALPMALTLLFGFALAAVSYALVESPAREALRRWEFRRATPAHKVPPLDSAVSDLPEPIPR